MTEQNSVAIKAANPPDLPGLPMGETPVISLEGVAKWYGDVVAVSDLSLGIGDRSDWSPRTEWRRQVNDPESHCGFARSIRRHGPGARSASAEVIRSVYRQMGLASEREQLYGSLRGREFVRLNAILQKVPQPDAATDRAIDLVDMADAADRALSGYSKGMRQRIKVAAALVHDPQILLLDEPLNGTDPVQRASMIALISRLGDEGKTVVVSSHVLSEVERFARNVLVIINGKLAAAGDFRAIRDRMDERDHMIRIRSDDARRLAAALLNEPATTSVRMLEDGKFVAETNDVRRFTHLAA